MASNRTVLIEDCASSSEAARGRSGPPKLAFGSRTRKVTTSPIDSLLLCCQRRQHAIKTAAHLGELALVGEDGGEPEGAAPLVSVLKLYAGIGLSFRSILAV